MSRLESDPATSTFEAVIVAGGERVADLMSRAEEQLELSCKGYGPALERWAGATLSAGGKRLRPLLVFLCGTPDDSEELVRVGAAVELVHMATLVHDDVVDEAPMRRGRPTVFAAEGHDAALATGDFLFARALMLLVLNGSAAQTQVLSDACLALSRGEFAQRQDAFADSVGVDRYLHRCDLKTGRLFAAACMLGAMAAKRSDEEVALLGSFGSSVGRAFQMLDDVLDVVGPPELTGKRRGTDLLEGTTTLPLVLARKLDPNLAGLDLRQLENSAHAEAVCDLIIATGAPEDARGQATALVRQAKESLRDSLDKQLRSALGTVADGIVERYA